MHEYSMLLERRRKSLVLIYFFSRSRNESFLDINVRWQKKNEERKSKTGERDRWPRGGRGSVLSPPKCFWPRMKMTGEKEPTTRETDRAVDGRDWLIEEESGGHVIITDSPRIC